MTKHSMQKENIMIQSIHQFCRKLKEKTKFDEFINVYKYAISLVDKESRIRYYLDSKK